MKQALKAFLKKPRVLRWGAWIVAHYIALVYKTSSWRFVGEEIPRRYWASGKPFIVCFWHNRLLMACFAWQSSTPFRMLISAHPDGKLIAETVGFYGIETTVGSSSKGGAEALRSLLKALKRGETVGLTPDGPRGPRFQVSDGIVSLARLSGLDVVGVTFATSRRRVLKSWDRFILALPFSKGVIAWAEPLTLARHSDDKAIEVFRQTLQRRLTALTQKADTLCGVGTVH